MSSPPDCFRRGKGAARELLTAPCHTLASPVTLVGGDGICNSSPPQRHKSTASHSRKRNDVVSIQSGEASHDITAGFRASQVAYFCANSQFFHVAAGTGASHAQPNVATQIRRLPGVIEADRSHAVTTSWSSSRWRQTGQLPIPGRGPTTTTRPVKTPPRNYDFPNSRGIRPCGKNSTASAPRSACASDPAGGGCVARSERKSRSDISRAESESRRATVGAGELRARGLWRGRREQTTRTRARILAFQFSA